VHLPRGDTGEVAPLVAHLERFLGEITRGWPVGEAGSVRFSIVEFADAPGHGLATYSTLGLSDHVLSMGEGAIRQELMLVRAVDSPAVEARDAAMLLSDAADGLLGRHQAILRHELVVPPDKPPAASALHVFWARSPTFLPDEFTGFESQPPVAFVWLVPVTEQEVHAFVERGSSWLEDLFVRLQPDVYDFARPSSVR
jgi:hypothetical protein